MTRIEIINLIHHLLQELESGNQISSEDWELIYFFIETERDCQSNEDI